MNDRLPPDVNPRTRNRLPPVDRDALDETGRRMYDEVEGGDPTGLVSTTSGPPAILLHDAAFYALWRPTNRYLRYQAGLDARLIEVAILATAREMDAHFEWHAHERDALAHGVAPATVEVIRRRAPVDGLPEPEAALVRLAREALGAHRVRPETFALARKHFSEKQLVDYVALIGTYTAVAVLLETFDQQLPANAVSALPPR